MKKLILWDIDGTLISSGGMAGEAMRAAMRRVYGDIASESRVSYAGKTDRQIILDTFADRAQGELFEVLEHFTSIYLEELEQRRAELLARCKVLDGVVAALERLATQPALQTVLTGNLKPVAQIKLDMTQLARYIDLEVGAYGSDHHERPALVPIAVARVQQRYGVALSGADVVVIGDTPNDIDCGRAAGARTIAVATGSFSTAQLRAAGGEFVLPNLADTNRLIDLIMR